MMWTASLAGQVRQTYLPKWKSLLPVFEALMNAYQAIQDASPNDPRIIINLKREAEFTFVEAPPVSAFVIVDNGVGFDDANMQSFATAFSLHKSTRGGKGLGRLLWLKAFEKVEIDSVFRDAADGELVHRKIDFDENFSPEHVKVQQTDRENTGTIVTLQGFRDPWKSETPSSADHIARRICEHFILILMRSDCPKIILRDGNEEISINKMFEDQFRSSSKEHEFQIGNHLFSVQGFRINESRSARNKLVYCADERAVLGERLDKFIPNMASRLQDSNGKFAYLAVVRGKYLNDRVNHARTEFFSDDDDEQNELNFNEEGSRIIGPDLKRSEIREKCLDFVQDDLKEILGDINTGKMKRIHDYVASEAPHYRILLRRVDEFIDRIPVEGSKNELEAALHKELHQREIELKREGGKIILEAAKLNEYDHYHERLTNFMENYNEIGVAQLAQYVAHRKIILDLFRKAISADARDGKYPLERVLHHLIFPMKSDSEELLLSQQNLWILDERLNYHSFVASDRGLNQIEALGTSSRLRPDLVVFDRQFTLSESSQPLTSLTIVEFKRPMRDDYTDEENPLKQVANTIKAIRSGESLDQNRRKIKVASRDIPTNCYIVCDITPKLREQLADWDATLTPDGQGYYGFHRTHGFYYEVSDYDQVLMNAERRNQMLFERLKLL